MRPRGLPGLMRHPIPTKSSSRNIIILSDNQTSPIHTDAHKTKAFKSTLTLVHSTTPSAREMLKAYPYAVLKVKIKFLDAQFSL